MPVTISGSTGIQNVLGSASAPAESNTTSSNTGLYFPTSTTLGLSTAGTNALYVDASQNVGIGTTSPGALLELSAANASVYSAIRLTNTTGSGTTPGAGIEWARGGSVKSSIVANTYGNDYMAFSVNGNTERMRIDTSGNLLVGATSFLYGAKLSVSGSLYMTGGSIENWAGAYNLYNSANQYIGLQWYKSATGSLAGNSRQAVIETQIDNKMNIKTDVNIPIYVIANASNGVYLSGGGTSWTSNSDERLKTDLVPIADAANKVVSLRAVTGRYKHDVSGTSRSFLIAQDVQKVLPEAINIQNDENNTLGLQYTDVIPLLVAAIQELKAEFDAYKAAHP